MFNVTITICYIVHRCSFAPYQKLSLAPPLFNIQQHHIQISPGPVTYPVTAVAAATAGLAK